MSENGKMSISVSQSPQTTSSNVLFCPQPKDNQFTVIEEKKNWKIFTFKKLESKNFDFFSKFKVLKAINQLSK